MKNGYNYEDYLFVSARIRAKENSLIGHSDLMSMVSASSIDELYRMLDDKGIVAENDPRNGRNYDAVLAKRLSDAYASVFSDIPERSLFTVFTYPYDCHNLKTAIKYAQKGSSGASVMIPLGTVSPEKTEEAVIKGDFSAFPSNMAKAAENAVDEFCKTKDPQIIDLILDYACFEDISESTKVHNVPFVTELLAIKADTVNIFTSVRLARRYSEKTFTLPENALVVGGKLPHSFFTEVFAEAEPSGVIDILADKLTRTEYSVIADRLKAGEYDIGKLCDDLYISKVRQARQTLAGVEVAAGYIAATEYEVKNLRILIAGKRAGLDAKSIAERLRGSYV